MRTIMTTLTTRTSAETKELFRECFEASGADSQGDFLRKLLDKWNQEEPIYKPEIKTEYVEKKLDQNQILLTLSPVQYFALRAGVLSYPDFAEKQNEIIDSLKKGAPFFYSGNLYDPDFNGIWIRNIALTKTMTDEEKENAIQHNMSAFLLNLYLMNVIEENLGTIRIKPGHIKAFIQKNNPVKRPETREIKTLSNGESDSIE